MPNQNVHLENKPSNASGMCGLPDGERQLLAECLGGHQDAQQKLYEQHCDKVYRLMCRMVGSSNADDLTQQVFLCVFQKLNKFQGRSSFSTWLYRLASNEALQFLRRRPQRVPDQPMLSDPSDEQTDEITQLDQRDLLEHALSRLDPNLRAIILLREIEQLSYYDIALALDIAEGTVASRLSRARHCLRKLIDEAANS